MRPAWIALAPALAAWALSGCKECVRDGCDAYARPAHAALSRGLAGAVAYATDVVSDGCQECTFSEATLQVWKVDAPVTTPEQACAASVGLPAFSIVAKPLYAQPLEVGSYVLCVPETPSRRCVGVSILEGKVTTANVKLIYGPAAIAVFPPGSDEADSRPPFDCRTAPI